jgi:hypothetical protein
VDFYAGAIATFAVILFAKFVTHHVSHSHKNARRRHVILCVLRWLCVVAAGFGLALSLVILAEIPLVEGWDDATHKGGRWAVCVTVAISAALLAIDVAIFGQNPDGTTTSNAPVKGVRVTGFSGEATPAPTCTTSEVSRPSLQLSKDRRASCVRVRLRAYWGRRPVVGSSQRPLDAYLNRYE